VGPARQTRPLLAAAAVVAAKGRGTGRGRSEGAGEGAGRPAEPAVSHHDLNTEQRG
jgi:hypothetical protein